MTDDQYDMVLESLYEELKKLSEKYSKVIKDPLADQELLKQHWDVIFSSIDDVQDNIRHMSMIIDDTFERITIE